LQPLIISLVVAAAENNVIGKNNALLWHLPNDMKFFKNITWGMVVIMGRKTFESLGKPLAGRKNIVITRQPGWSKENVVTVHDIHEALAVARQMDVKEVFVIGGGELYTLSLPMARRIYLTRVHASPEGDTFFPDFKKDEWALIHTRNYTTDEKHAYSYSFQLWEKTKLPEEPPLIPA
jgi:dihydrofolate reductase